MSYNFIGDIENLSQLQLEFVSEVLKKHGYAGKEVSVQPVGKPGDNYSSDVKRFKVQFENNKELKMIAKIAPSSTILRDQRPMNEFFINETLVYKELLPMYRQLQENVGVPEEDMFRYPVCYGALDVAKNEIILIEDLEPHNFIMLDKANPLSDEVVKIILKNLANFHSLSYILKKNESKIFDKFVGTLTNATINSKNMEQTQMIFENALNDMNSLFNNDRYTNIINDMRQNLAKIWVKLVSSDRHSKYSVIQHGDFWTNNIMFQMQGDHPVGCVLIDYQLARDSLPVADIHYLIFSCTDYETRSKHYHEWMDYYHSELDRYLNYFDLKVNYLYPRDKFDADLKRYCKPCLGIAIIMINFLMRQMQEAPDMATINKMDGERLPDSFKVGQLTDNTVKAIKERVEGLIESCYEYGYLTEPPTFT